MKRHEKTSKGEGGVEMIWGLFFKCGGDGVGDVGVGAIEIVLNMVAR